MKETKRLDWPGHLKVRVLVGKPDLSWYDYIVVSTSGGKDSQTVIRVTAELARDRGLLDRVIALHSDLGPTVEWPEAGKYAREQAEAVDIPRFETVTRIGGTASKDSDMYHKGDIWGDLLDMVRRKGEWPDDKARYCTSDFKRGPILNFYTKLARAWNKEHQGERERRGKRGAGELVDRHGRTACRILEVTGLRASEAPRRAKRPEFYTRIESPVRRVDSWMPIKWWTDADVWADICESGIPYHPAYDRGMDRLSCVFCFYAKLHQLVASGYQNPEALAEYIATEREIGKPFRPKLDELGWLSFVAEELEANAEDDITPKRDGHAGCGRFAKGYGSKTEWVVLHVIRRGEVSMLADKMTRAQAIKAVKQIADSQGLVYEHEVYPLAWIGAAREGRKLTQEAFVACPADSALWPTFGAPKWPWGKELPEGTIR